MKLDEIRAERNHKIARLLRYFGVTMAIFYFVMGLGFMLLPWFAYLEEMKYVTGFVLIVYGCFRFYRQMKQKPRYGTMIDQSHTEDDDPDF